MAKKKTRRKTRRKKQPAVKGWVLLSSGILIGLFVALLLFLNHQQPTSKQPAAKVATPPKAATSNTPPTQVEEVSSKYDFYGSLPSSRVVVPDGGDDTDSKTIVVQDEKEFSDRYSSYSIQVGSFKKAAGADQQKAALAMLGYEPVIEKTRLHDGTTVHRVLLGPFVDLNTVNQTRTRLHSQKIDNTLLKSE